MVLCDNVQTGTENVNINPFLKSAEVDFKEGFFVFLVKSLKNPIKPKKNLTILLVYVILIYVQIGAILKLAI